MKTLALIFIFSMSLLAQSADDVKKAINDLQKEVTETKREVKVIKAQRAQEARRRAERRVARRREEILRESEKAIDSKVEVKLVELEKGKTPEEQQALITALLAERARLVEAIRKNNGKWRCEIFGIGCMKLKQ